MTTADREPLRIGTRGSPLALVQAGLVCHALETAGVPAVLEVIVTAGDRRAADTTWGEGAFVAAIEDALLSGRVDVAVHSAKDVPTEEDPRLTIAAFMPRADPADVLVLAAGRQLGSLDELPVGARVGTDSPRRTAFLQALRPDLRMHPLHGNVDTRLRRLDESETDALVLAAAGLERLGRSERVSLRFEPETLPPAPGQGALAVQTRADDPRTLDLAGRLDDRDTRRAVTAERALLAASGGGCRAPLGALGRVDGAALELLGGYARVGGGVRVVGCRRSEGDDEELVDALLDDLAVQAAARAAEGPGPRIIVTRPSGQAASTVLALVDRGLVPLSVPSIAIEPVDDEALDGAVRSLATYDWVVVTSSNSVRALSSAARRMAVGLGADGARVGERMGPGPRWAVVGRATGRALAVAGVSADLRPPRSNGAALADAVPLAGGERVLLPRGDLADAVLPERLRARGARVDEVVVYRTVEAPTSSVARLEAALASAPEAVLFTSGSTVRGLLALATRLGPEAEVEVRRLRAICIGPGTAAVAMSFGFAVAAEAPMQGPGGIADAAARAFQLIEETP